MCLSSVLPKEIFRTAQKDKQLEQALESVKPQPRQNVLPKDPHHRLHLARWSRLFLTLTIMAFGNNYYDTYTLQTMLNVPAKGA